MNMRQCCGIGTCLNTGAATNSEPGEAETLAIIECRNIRALFVTDDQSVGRVAPPGSPKVVGTWELLRASHRRECVTADELWDYSRRLHEAERHTPPTGPFDRGAFNSGCEADVLRRRWGVRGQLPRTSSPSFESTRHEESANN